MSKRMIENLLGAGAGEIASVTPSFVLVTNGLSHGVTEFVAKSAAPEKVLVMFDHNVPCGSPEDAKVFGEILKMANTYEIKFRQAKGIALQYMFDEIIQPGEIVVTGTKHSAIFGAKGALGVHVTNTELARVIEKDKYNVTVPETVGVSVTGKLRVGVSAMDAAMTFLAEHGDSVINKAVEFISADMSEYEKAILCGMACETGAYTAFSVDSGETSLTLDLSAVVPMVTMPCSASNTQASAERKALVSLAGTELHAGQIGGFTGGTIENLRLAAKMIEGKKLAYGFRLTICPATSEDYLKAIEEGLIEKFIDFNAQISAAGDHSVVPQGAGTMGPKEKLITTGMYTYAGCMGCDDAEVYTASVESVINAAVAKRI